MWRLGDVMTDFFKVLCIIVQNVLIRFSSGGVLCYGKNNKIKKPFTFFKHHITISGSHNIIDVAQEFEGRLHIRIIGDKNYIKIGTSRDAAYRIDVFPRLASKCNNTKIIIGDNVLTSNQTWLKVGEHNSSIVIGNNTMISWDVTIWNTDCHSILTIEDSQNETPLNVGQSLQIGEHCWIGKGASILKNVALPDNTIVGMGAVVTKKVLDTPYCVLAGNPARVIKEDVRWDIRSPSDLLEVSHAE